MHAWPISHSYLHNQSTVTPGHVSRTILCPWWGIGGVCVCFVWILWTGLNPLPPVAWQYFLRLQSPRWGLGATRCSARRRGSPLTWRS
jgi:hypothetical protein